MNLSDFELIQKVQKGDAQAFEELVYRYDEKVLNMALSFRNSADDAKDIYQEVFIRAFKGLKNFKFKSEFSTWLYRITSNVCISYNDKKNRTNHDSIDKRIDDGEDSATFADLIEGTEKTDSKVIGSEIGSKIKAALDTLPSQQKLAFTLKFYEELKIKEIAEIMNCAEGTVKRYLFNATNKMKNHLKRIYD